MAETMFKTAQEMLFQRRKDTQDNLLAIKAIEEKQRERPLSGYAKFGGMLGKAAGESLKDYLGVKNEGDYLRDYESGIEQRRVMEQNLRAEGSEYSPEVAAQVLAQQDRFIEESGSNLTPEIKRTSDFTRAMKGLTPEQLNDPMQVAKVYNDFGYTKEAVDLLSSNRMNPYQKESIRLNEEELRLKQQELNSLYGVGTGAGGGAPAGGGTNPRPNELSEGTNLLVIGVPNVIVNGAPVPKANIEALDKAGLRAETGVFGNIWNAVTTPFNLLADASQEVEDQRLIASVKNAFETGAFSPEARRAAKQVLELPRELTGLTDKQYDLLGKLDGLRTGGQ